MELFNHSKLIMEKAKKQTCPRCSGFGYLISDNDACFLCHGKGVVWMSESGWIRPLNGRIGKSEQLY